MVQLFLIAYTSTRIPKQVGLFRAEVMLKVPFFVSKAGHFHLICLSVTIIAENQTSKTSSDCFYWESLCNRWVLSRTLMNTMRSPCFANRQNRVVDFQLIAGTGPMKSSQEETWAGYKSPAGTCPTNLEHFDFVGLGAPVVGWASGCHVRGRECDSGRTNTQGL